MSDNQKYYYLKLKDDFFNSDSMVVLESMQDGYLYSNILLKLYLRSLKYDGRLMFNEKIPYNPTVLATITRHTVGAIEKSLSVFQQLGLVEILDNGAIYMSDIQNFIGKSSTEADRKRNYRIRIEQEKGQMSGQLSDKNPPEIEIEIEKDIDIELDKDKEKKTKPTTENDIFKDRTFTEPIKNKILEWLTYKQERKEAYKPTGLKSFLTEVENKLKVFDEADVLQLFNECMANGWKGVIWDRLKDKPKNKQSYQTVSGTIKNQPKKQSRFDFDEIEKQDLKFLKQFEGDDD